MKRIAGLFLFALVLAGGPALTAEARHKTFVPADRPGPFAVGYNRVELLDASRDVTFPEGGRTLTTHLWYPIDAATAAAGIPVVYDSGLVSLFESYPFAFPSAHFASHPTLGALVDPSSQLPASLDGPGSCPPPLDPLGCARSDIVPLPISSRGRFAVLMFSHGSFLEARTYASYAEYLATHGYIVVAPDHTGNRFVDFLAGFFAGVTSDGFGSCGVGFLAVRPCGDSIQGVSTNRPEDIRFVLSEVLSGAAGIDPASINAHQIGAFGHSFGGYTSLVLAGGADGPTPGQMVAPDPRIKAIAPLSPPIGDPTTQPIPRFGEIGIPALVSYGTLDKTLGIDFFKDGRSIFDALDTTKTGKKYRLEIQRAVHLAYANSCEAAAGMLEVIAQGNDQGIGPFDQSILGLFLAFDGQFPIPTPVQGQSRDGLQAFCSPDLFYGTNAGVWDTVTLGAPPFPQLSDLLLDEEDIPGFIDSETGDYVPALESSQTHAVAHTYLTAFFNRHVRKDRRHWFYLTPFYTKFFQPNAQFELCFTRPFRNREHCFDNIDD